MAMEHDRSESLPELRLNLPPDQTGQPSTHSNSLPRSITALPQTHAAEGTSQFPGKAPSDGSEHNSAKSPLDQRDNPYDLASGALHAPGLMSRRRTADTHASRGLDWIIPHESDIEEKKLGSFRRPATVGERLMPTIKHAKDERTKYGKKAVLTGYALNIAIGLQILLGALTTGLPAATNGKQTTVMVSILGGLATLVASYLARARGSGEPELSNTRCKGLDHFIRDAEAFLLDHGHSQGNEFDKMLEKFRKDFEVLLGNAEERKLSPPV